jgi:hypothetical protein
VVARLTTSLVFGFSSVLVATASLLVFGSPAKESRTFLALLIAAPAVSAGVASLLLVSKEQRGSRPYYRFGFLRGAVVGLANLAVFACVMAALACPEGDWIECVLRTLEIFGFIMGIPSVAVSGLIGLLLDEILNG